jgi:hypothetical protein
MLAVVLVTVVLALVIGIVVMSVLLPLCDDQCHG